jgi:hypothetical protein
LPHCYLITGENFSVPTGEGDVPWRWLVRDDDLIKPLEPRTIHRGFE